MYHPQMDYILANGNDSSGEASTSGSDNSPDTDTAIPDQDLANIIHDLSKEPMLGNISMHYASPIGYTGPAKPGHLVFDAMFECGNLASVTALTECEYDLYLRPDTCNSKQRLWFYFSVGNVLKDQKVIFNVVNFSKTKSLYGEGMAPLARSSSRTKWQRIPPRHVHYHRSAEHNKSHVMSFAFAFDKPEDTYYFVFSYPYSFSQLKQFLIECEAKKKPFFSVDLLAMTVQHRALDLITITESSNRHLAADRVQKIIMITARVHPGETPASFICQGLIRFLMSASPFAQKLRNNYVFKIVPMLNPDGVYLGNYRCSLMGFDLNRQWLKPSVWAHPTLHAVKKFMVEHDQDPEVEVVYFVDIHAHSTKLGAFMYGNEFNADPERCQRQMTLPTLLSDIADDYSLTNTQFNTDAKKAGTGRRAMGGVMSENTLCYTLEVSFYAYESQKDPTLVIPYTEEKYERLGENLALAFYRAMVAEESSKDVKMIPMKYFAADSKKHKKNSGNKK